MPSRFIQELAEVYSGAVTRIYAQQDANHDVTAITDSSGNVLERFIYDPYGAVNVRTAAWAATGDSKNWLYLFQGGRLDTFAGNYSFRSRDYRPPLGTWTEADIPYIDGANLYRAFGSNPVAFTDPFGHMIGQGNAMYDQYLDNFMNNQVFESHGEARNASGTRNWNNNMQYYADRARDAYRHQVRNMKDLARAEAQLGTFGAYQDPCPNKYAHAAAPWLAVPLTGLAGRAFGALRALASAARGVEEVEAAEDAAAAGDAAENGAGDIPGCFVAGTPVLVVDGPVSASAAAAAGPWPVDRRALGLQLIFLGVYGTYVIHRVRRALFLKKAEQELASLGPLEVPLRPSPRQPRNLLALPLDMMFSTQPITMRA